MRPATARVATLAPPGAGRALAPALLAALLLAFGPQAARAGAPPDPDQVAAWMRALPPPGSPEYAAATAKMRQEFPELEGVLLEIVGGGDLENLQAGRCRRKASDP